MDPLSGYDPIGEVEHYIDGEHNGGVFNDKNLNVYAYTYQNPVRYIDPNGKQVLANIFGVDKGTPTNSSTPPLSTSMVNDQKVLNPKTSTEQGKDAHSLSKTARKVSGQLSTASKPFQEAFKKASLYGEAKSWQKSHILIEKNLPKALSGKNIIHQSLGEMNSVNAGKVATGLKYAGKAFGVTAVTLGMYDIDKNGVNWSNGLDTGMAGLSLIGNRYASGIAATYFLEGFVSKLTTGKDIGEHVQSAVENNNNNNKQKK